MAKTPTAAGAAAPKTACEQGGDEILPFEIRVRTEDPVEFVMNVCKANARVRAWLRELPTGADQLQVDESGKSTVRFNLPSLPAGRYLLRWSVLTPSPNWQTRTEVQVASITMFRRRKMASGDNPVNMGVLLLEVV
jgi:hypothetical protein